ncbi:MAG: nuclear transport factor 2 family protein, partial [Bacteroidota bacterium]
MTIEQQHQQIIQRFYTAFQQLDPEKMVAYYDDDILFEDPAFGQLRGEQARNMW